MITLNRHELMKNLELVRPGISTRGLIELVSCVHFTGESLVTGNGSTYVSVPFTTGIEATVNWTKLYGIVAELEQEEIQISRRDKELLLSAGNAQAGLALIEGVILPIPTDEAVFVPFPEGLVDALKFCRFSTGKDGTQPYLSCIYVEGDKVYSSDNWRITQVVLPSRSPFDFLFPAEALQCLESESYGITDIAVDGSWVHLKNRRSGLLVSVITMSTKWFAGVEQFFEVEGISVEFPPALARALERAALVTEGESAPDARTDLILEPGKITCTVRRPIMWFEETMPIDYDGPKVSIAVIPQFMSQILGRTNRAIIGDTRCLMLGDSFQHVMALIGE